MAEEKQKQNFKKSEKTSQKIQKPQFVPTEGRLSADQMKFGYWFVTHRLLIRRLILLFLIGLNVILVSYIVYSLLNLYVLNISQKNVLHGDLTSPRLDYQLLSEVSEPVPLTINFETAVKANEEEVTIVAEVVNTNNTWYAPELVYHFESGDQMSKQSTDFILPGQTKYLIAAGEKNITSFAQVNLIIDKINWKKQAFYQELSDKILHIEIQESKYSAPNQSGTEKVGSLDFTVANKSAYNFWDVKNKILLYRGNRLIFASSYPLSSLDSGESIDLSISIFNEIPSPSRIEIFPDVDILNPDSFKGFEAKPVTSEIE